MAEQLWNNHKILKCTSNINSYQDAVHTLIFVIFQVLISDIFSSNTLQTTWLKL